MTIEEWFYAYLKASPEVNSLVGGPAAFRLYPEMAPQNAAYPHGTYQLIDYPTMYDLLGPSGIAHPRIQLDWWDNSATGKKKVVELVEATRKAKGGLPNGRGLDGYFGDHIGGFKVFKCQLVDRQYTIESPAHANEQPFRRASMDFVIHFEEL